MLSLDRGGVCRGVVFRLPPDNLEGQLDKLVRREITVKPPNNIPRWISVETEQGSLRAIAFVMNRQSRSTWGGCRPSRLPMCWRKPAAIGVPAPDNFFDNTVAHLEEQGIRDRNLWRLQALVAERIKPDASDPRWKVPC